MTLINKSWLKNEVLRLWLSGDSQEAIANQIKISVGTVNSLVNEIMKSDDTIDLQRQIAIVSKKNGIDIRDIAANLRWKNLIKQSSLDERKIEKFLDAMGILFNKYSIKPSTAANQFYSLIETMLRDNIEPHKLKGEIKLGLDELQRIKDQIKINDELLKQSNAEFHREQERSRVKERDLQQFVGVRDMLELFGYYELSSDYGNLARMMIDFKNLNYDPKDILSKYERIESLTKAIEKLNLEFQSSEKTLESFRRKQKEEESKWKDYYNAFEIFTSLVNDGLRPEDIFKRVHILKKDFPERAVPQLIEDILTYGSLAGALSKLKREYDAKIEPML
ncbi:MAG: hypothetical protein QOC42_05185 [Nitrososphaeraceae archaeon]|nr:hypothetical protein [Nitrososphaeraceae archaeon]